MDIGILNSLGYIEVIEISIWLGVMYYGKCWIDSKFKEEKIMLNACENPNCDCENCDCENCDCS